MIGLLNFTKWNVKIRMKTFNDHYMKFSAPLYKNGILKNKNSIFFVADLNATAWLSFSKFCFYEV